MSTAVSDITQPLPGPRWTRQRLSAMLIECYGRTKRGRIDIEAVAEYVGVTASTVRRWISGPGTARRLSSIPERQLVVLQRGPELIERRNDQQFQHALQAIAAWSTGDGVREVWRTQGWLAPHSVIRVAINGKPWHQVVISNANSRSMNELRRRATILQTVVLPTRFHAVVLAHFVMTRLRAWRVHPAPEQLATGRTQVWMNEAPDVDLQAIAGALWNKPKKSSPRETRKSPSRAKKA